MWATRRPPGNPSVVPAAHTDHTHLQESPGRKQQIYQKLEGDRKQTGGLFGSRASTARLNIHQHHLPSCTRFNSRFKASDLALSLDDLIFYRLPLGATRGGPSAFEEQAEDLLRDRGVVLRLPPFISEAVFLKRGPVPSGEPSMRMKQMSHYSSFQCIPARLILTSS